MKASLEMNDVKGKLEIESKEAQEILNYLIPEFCKDGIGIINDLVKSWRWQNQIRILKKSKKYLEDNNLKVSEVPLKILIPLLDKASLEEDETLQDKWAKLLAYVSLNGDIEYTRSFIYILEQLTTLEANILNRMYNEEKMQPNKKFRVDEVSQSMSIDKEKLEIIFDNLIRLGILIQGSRGNGIDTGMKISVVQNIRPNGNYKITNYGQKFLLVCEGY